MDTLFKGALQLLMNRYMYIRVALVPERVSTKSFVSFDDRKVEVESLKCTEHLGLRVNPTLNPKCTQPLALI